MIKSSDPNFAYLITNEDQPRKCTLTSYVATDILEIVNRLEYVPLKILKAWLPEGVRDDTIIMHLNSLDASQRIVYDRKEKVACGKNFMRYGFSEAEKLQNNLIVPAASVLCQFKKLSEKKELMFYTRTSYPTQIMFITLEGFAADVTALQPSFLEETDPLRTILPKFWAANIPDGEQDNICHIAVFPGNENWSGYPYMKEAAKRIGFDAYAFYDPETLAARFKNL